MGKYKLIFNDEKGAMVIEQVYPTEFESVIPTPKYDSPINLRYMVHKSGHHKYRVSVAISYDPDFSSTICDGLREDRLEAFVKARWPKINKILDCDFGASMLSVHPQIITKSREGPRRKPKL